MSEKKTAAHTSNILSVLEQLTNWLPRVYLAIAALGALGLAGVGVLYGVREDDDVARYYRAYLAAHPSQVPVQLTSLGALHIETALSFSQDILTGVVAFATIVYAWVAFTMRQDAKRAAAVQAATEERSLVGQDRAAAALERLAAILEHQGSEHPGEAVRPLLVINIGRRGATSR